MNRDIAIILMLFGIFISCSSANAQGETNNCCTLEVGVKNTSVTMPVTVPPSAGNAGGSYQGTVVQTINVACVNTAKSAPCSAAANTFSNVVTANGFGTFSAAQSRFVACNPTFVAQPVTAATATNGQSFTNIGTSFGSIDASGNCVASAEPLDKTECIIVECPVSSGPDPEPPCVLRGGGDQNPEPCSPIILDLSGKGFVLTNAANGVKFDIAGTGTPIQIGWTAEGADNAFLALPGPDGLVHSGAELFGDFTPQPKSDHPNGFIALAVYDLPANGGNGDGIIDSRDAIYSSLRLWIDANHDGISQPEELHTLQSEGVVSISLNYTLSRRVDQYGNVFRYKASVDPNTPDPTNVGRIAYDVFFVAETPSAKCVAPFVPRGIAAGSAMSGKF
jgi:hypothetical protein